MEKVQDMKHQFAICVSNLGYEVSLEKWKVYPLISEKSLTSQGMVRAVDESGEDYLFPEDCFIAIKLPEQVKALMMSKAV